MNTNKLNLSNYFKIKSKSRFVINLLKSAIILFYIACDYNDLFGQSLQTDWVQQTLNVNANQIILDHYYNIYSTGIDYNFDSDGDILIMKYDSSGNILWREHFAGNNGVYDNGFSICLDDSDNVYVAGLIDDNNTTSTGIVIKYDSSGSLKWFRSANYSGESGKVLSDGIDNIYTLEYINDVAHSVLHAGISKYNYNGTLLWTEIDTSSAETIGYDLSIDKLKNLYVVGNTEEALPGQKSFLTKYDTSGNLIWKQVFRDSIYSFSDTKIMCLDDSANIYMTGYTAHSGTMTGYDCITMKYDSTGSLKWFKVYTTSGNNNESPLGIFCNKNRIGITGRLELNNSGSNFADIFTIGYNLNGNLLFTDTVNGPSSGADFGNDIVIDSSDNTFVTGVLSDGTAVFQIILQYDSTGQRSFANLLPNSQGIKIIIDDKNIIYTCGNFGDTILNLSYGTVIKYLPMLNTGIADINFPLQFQIYPNPFINKINIINNQVYSGTISIKIFDSQGKLVNSCNDISDNYIQLFLDNISPGAYVFELEEQNNFLRKLIIKL